MVVAHDGCAKSIDIESTSISRLRFILNLLPLSKVAAERFDSAPALSDALQDWVEGRAPVVCPRTAIQSALCSYGRYVDRHRLLGPVTTALVALTALLSTVFTVATLIR